MHFILLLIISNELTKIFKNDTPGTYQSQIILTPNGYNNNHLISFHIRVHNNNLQFDKQEWKFNHCDLHLFLYTHQELDCFYITIVPTAILSSQVTSEAQCSLPNDSSNPPNLVLHSAPRLGTIHTLRCLNLVIYARKRRRTVFI